ncbi:MAG: hypothetical protein LBB54_02960 [Cellulomonadaceae bacterium]|jgi:hypothetical protein|nr:hypothetical protein [Cellulomonadaceae bacterium]
MPTLSDDHHGTDDDDVERQFAEIAGSLSDIDHMVTCKDPPAPPPALASPPSLPAPPPSSRPTTTPHRPGRVIGRTPGPRDWALTPEAEALDDADSHFTPPDPGAVVTGQDRLLHLAWAAVIGIPVLAIVTLVLISTIPALHPPVFLGPLGTIFFLAAVATLIWRMPDGKRDDDDNTDGAVT